MNTDEDCSKPLFSIVEIRSPDSDPEQGGARPGFGPQNLCSFVFICGSLLPGAGIRLVGSLAFFGRFFGLGGSLIVKR
jgi:hypothetical protein